MERATGRLRWAGLEAQASQLCARGRALIESLGFVFIATLRQDGSPRISPIEAHLVKGQLMLVMIPATHKADDVLRDPRVMLQSPITDAADPGGEFKLWGHVVSTGDESQRRATADQIMNVSGWRPDGSWLFLTVEIEQAALLEWEKGEMVVTRWSHSAGLQPQERRKLDFTAGAYTPVAV